MAFLGQAWDEASKEALDVTLEKMAVLKDVAETRDAIIAANEDKPLKIIIGGVIGMWAIYHFLIKR